MASNVVQIHHNRDLHIPAVTASLAPMSSPTKEKVTDGPSIRDDEWTLLLLAVAEKRDQAAFSQLFNHFAPLLKAFALSQPGLSSNAEADEVVQVVLLKVWNRATTFNAGKASATTWIYTLARNARIDILRKQTRQSVEVKSDDLWDIPDDSEAPPARMEQTRVQQDIRSALSSLPIEQREIVGKVYIEGKSHSEVANELNLPLGTVKSRIRLALSKLKLILDR